MKQIDLVVKDRLAYQCLTLRSHIERGGRSLGGSCELRTEMTGSGMAREKLLHALTGFQIKRLIYPVSLVAVWDEKNLNIPYVYVLETVLASPNRQRPDNFKQTIPSGSGSQRNTMNRAFAMDVCLRNNSLL